MARNTKEARIHDKNAEINERVAQAPTKIQLKQRINNVLSGWAEEKRQPIGSKDNLEKGNISFQRALQVLRQAELIANTPVTTPRYKPYQGKVLNMVEMDGEHKELPDPDDLLEIEERNRNLKIAMKTVRVGLDSLNIKGLAWYSEEFVEQYGNHPQKFAEIVINQLARTLNVESSELKTAVDAVNNSEEGSKWLNSAVVELQNAEDPQDAAEGLAKKALGKITQNIGAETGRIEIRFASLILLLALIVAACSPAVEQAVEDLTPTPKSETPTETGADPASPEPIPATATTIPEGFSLKNHLTAENIVGAGAESKVLSWDGGSVEMVWVTQVVTENGENAHVSEIVSGAVALYYVSPSIEGNQNEFSGIYLFADEILTIDRNTNQYMTVRIDEDGQMKPSRVLAGNNLVPIEESGKDFGVFSPIDPTEVSTPSAATEPAPATETAEPIDPNETEAPPEETTETPPAGETTTPDTEETEQTPELEIKEAPFDTYEVAEPFDNFSLEVIDNNIWGEDPDGTDPDHIRKIKEFYYVPEDYEEMVRQTIQAAREKLVAELQADDFRAYPGAKPYLERAIAQMQEQEGAPMFGYDLYTNEPYVSPEGDPFWFVTEETQHRVILHIAENEEQYAKQIDLSQINSEWGNNGVVTLHYGHGEVSKSIRSGYFYDEENDLMITVVNYSPNSSGNDIYQRIREHDASVSGSTFGAFEHLLKSFGFRYWQLQQGPGVNQQRYSSEFNKILKETIGGDLTINWDRESPIEPYVPIVFARDGRPWGFVFEEPTNTN